MSSVPPPNTSDIRRTAVDSSIEQPGGGTEGTVDSSLNEAPQYFRSLELEFLRVMDRDSVAKQFYDMATVSYHGTHEDGLKAAIIALSNAARNRKLRDGQPGT